jgi:predicted transcriptional regulator
MQTIEKSKVLEYINDLPDQFSVNEMMERIVLLSKIDRAMKQSENGETVPHEQVVEKFKKWKQR